MHIVKEAIRDILDNVIHNLNEHYSGDNSSDTELHPNVTIRRTFPITDLDDSLFLLYIKCSHQTDGLSSDYFLVSHWSDNGTTSYFFSQSRLRVNRIELLITHCHVFLSQGIKKQLINQCSDNSPGIFDTSSNKNIIVMSEMEL